jgi:hypothetical protein
LFIVPGLIVAFKETIIPRTTTAKSPPAILSSPKFLWAWLIPTWLVFEALPTKLAHYPMPTYPALALMAGLAFERMISLKDAAPPVWTRYASMVLFALASILLLIIISPPGLEALRQEGARDFAEQAARISEIWRQDWENVGSPIWPFLLGIVVTSATLFFFFKQQYDRAFFAIIACSLIVGTSLRGLILPNQSWIIATYAAMAALDEVCGYPEGSAAKAKARHCDGIPAPQIVRAVNYAEPSFVFSVNGKTTLSPKSSTQLPPLVDEARPVWLINTMQDDGKLALQNIVSQAANAGRCVRLARRFVKNYSNNDASELVAVAVESDRCTPQKAG